MGIPNSKVLKLQEIEMGKFRSASESRLSDDIEEILVNEVLTL
jgi:hypothetical protein